MKISILYDGNSLVDEPVLLLLNSTTYLFSTMKDIILFRKILHLTDFSENSSKALNYAVNLCEIFKGELVVLHTYRLISSTNNTDNTNAKLHTFKDDIEKSASEKYAELEKSLLSKNSFKSTFLSEVGFITDRIQSNVTSKNIDLVVLSTGMNSLINDELIKSKEKLVSKISCPVMVVPI